MKKFYFSMVAMMLVAAMTASAAEDFWYNGIAYKIIGTDSVEVTRPTGDYTSLGGAIVFPETVYNNNKSYTVAAIGESAFWKCKTITSVSIPKTVTSIGYRSFYDCTNLSSVTFENAAQSHLKVIGGISFSETAITTITIPESVKEIYSAFENCTNLTTANLPSSMDYLGSMVFYGCTSLKTVRIPSGIDTIKEASFRDCTSLTSITIPSNITKIEGTAFYGTGLTSITIPSSVTTIGTAAFGRCYGLTTVTIPSTATSIGYRVFTECTGLTSVNIQNNMIAARQFEGCTNLKTVNIGRNVTEIYTTSFESCPIETLNVSSNCAADIQYFSSAKPTLKTLTLTDGVTDLPENAFVDCSVLETVTLPRGLKSIGNSAFQNCTRMYDLIAKMPRPFAVDASVFSGVQQHGYCDLHVPQGSKFRYEAMEVWKEFTAITEDGGPGVKRGDVNADGSVDIADVVTVLNIMAGQ